MEEGIFFHCCKIFNLAVFPEINFYGSLFIYKLRNGGPETFPSTLVGSPDYLGSFNDC